MYIKKIPLDIDCGVKVTMEVIGGKWKSPILLALVDGAMRPCELHRQFPDASPRVINQQLKELEMHGMIQKKIYAELPPRSEYYLTDEGLSVISVIKVIRKWGDGYRFKIKEILNLE